MTMAEGNDMQLAAVVLHTYGVDAYTDTRFMYDYAFTNFERLNLRNVKLHQILKVLTRKMPMLWFQRAFRFQNWKKSMFQMKRKE